MAEFVDFTNATELEKFTLKLSGLMKEKEKLILKIKKEKENDFKSEARGNEIELLNTINAIICKLKINLICLCTYMQAIWYSGKLISC